WTAVEESYLDTIVSVTGVAIQTSADESRPGVRADVHESLDDLFERCTEGMRVRWLSDEAAPADRLLARGVTIDRRPLAQAGSVEGPRWLLEQSVTVTNHRYGN